MTAAVSIENLSKSYGSFRALECLSLEVREGEIAGLLGPNGAGKTTTIKLVTGLLRPDSGRVLLNGVDIAEKPLEAKKKFALVPDIPYLYGKLTGWEFMHFIAKIYETESEDIISLVSRHLEDFGLTDVCHDLIDSYSHGMKQRLLLASVMMRNPEIIILDEPMVGLDPAAARMVRNMLKEHALAKKTVFLSTHSLHDALDLCGRIAVIARGKLLAYGTYEELKEISGVEGSLEDIYLAIAGDR